MPGEEQKCIDAPIIAVSDAPIGLAPGQERIRPYSYALKRPAVGFRNFQVSVEQLDPSLIADDIAIHG
jgi:hypothetical protein